MFPPYNIFKVQNDGSLRWMESAADMERAKVLVRGLAAFSPGEYVITNLKGEKVSIKSPHKRMFQIGYDEGLSSFDVAVTRLYRYQTTKLQSVL